MTASKGASRAKARGASARSRANGKVKTVPFRGLKLTIPDEPPGDLAFSLQDGEVSVALRAVFGIEQYRRIRAKLSDAGLSLDQTLKETDDLVGACFNKWGTTEGE